MPRSVVVAVAAVLISGSALAVPPGGTHGSESQNAASQAGASSTDQMAPSQGSAGKSARAPASADAVTPGISCPGDAVVWVNLRSRGYHMQGDKFFGHTKRGKFMCRKAADAAGDHAIKPGSR